MKTIQNKQSACSNNVGQYKNGYIEGLRFLFCCIVMIHHSASISSSGKTLFPSGNMAVEFFFMLSGCLAMKHLDKMQNYHNGTVRNPMLYAMKYTINKIAKIFPYAAIGTILAYGWKLYYMKADLKTAFWNLIYLPYELFFLPMTGVMSTGISEYLNAPLWYISAMFITLPLVVYLAIKAADLFKNWVVWFMPLILHGWMIASVGGVGSWGEFLLFTKTGVIRAFADLLLGGAVYFASKRLRRIHFGTSMRVLLTGVELSLMVFSIYAFTKEGDPYLYELAVFWIAVSLAISFSSASFTSRLRGRLFEFLGEISLPMYCVHWVVFQFVENFILSYGYLVKLLITIGISIGIAIVSVNGIPFIQRNMKWKSWLTK